MQTIIKEEDLIAFNQEISTKVAAHNAALAEANKQAPTDQDIQNEYYQLRAEYDKRTFNAKQAEGTANRAAERVKYFEGRLKMLKSACSATDLANFRNKHGWYNQAAGLIDECEEDLASAVDFFKRMKAISVDTAKTLKTFDVARLEELKPIVAKQDAAYSFIKGTDRANGWGRW
jgi:hypothetical protein